jgi:hypothetical protein
MTLDVKFVKNNDIKLRFSVKNEIGNPLNITGYTIKWELKKSFDSMAFISKSTAFGTIVFENAMNGIFSVLINAEDTANIDAGTYYHEAVITNLAGESVTLTDSAVNVGQFVLREQYTQQ